MEEPHSTRADESSEDPPQGWSRIYQGSRALRLSELLPGFVLMFAESREFPPPQSQVRGRMMA